MIPIPVILRRVIPMPVLLCRALTRVQWVPFRLPVLLRFLVVGPVVVLSICSRHRVPSRFIRVQLLSSFINFHLCPVWLSSILWSLFLIYLYGSVIFNSFVVARLLHHLAECRLRFSLCCGPLFVLELVPLIGALTGLLLLLFS